MRRLLVGAVAAACLAGAPAAWSVEQPPLDTVKTQTFYVAMAHTDDEIDGWSMIERRSREDYIVWVVMTHGRTTEACQTKEEAARGWDDYWNLTFVEGMGMTSTEEAPQRDGPYRYQGKGSPVREPELSEEHPFGNPWVGMGTDACGDARIAGWHWFLDDMAALTLSVPSMDVGPDPWADDDFRGEFCPPGRHFEPDSNVALKQTGCVEVWADENGARIVLDLPEMSSFNTGEPVPPVRFTARDVADALQVVRSKRAAWGIPMLPEVGVLSVSHYGDYPGSTESWPGCRDFAHPEHKAVADANRHIDLDMGTQYGVAMCDEDPYLAGAETVVAPPDPATIVASNLVAFGPNETEHRVGPYVRNYGWLMPTYSFAASNFNYWKVFG